PVAVPGVIAVAPAGDPAAPGEVLAAPGDDILTAVPGGHYDYASGSSLAAAHVSGAIALLLGLRPQLDADALYELLRRSQAAPAGAINVCRAVAELRGVDDACDSAAASALAARAGTRRPASDWPGTLRMSRPRFSGFRTWYPRRAPWIVAALFA